MKKHTIRRGSSEYHEQRDHDLFCAYKQAFTRKDLSNERDTVRAAIKSPTPRFYVSEERAVRVVNQWMTDGCPPRMLPMQRMMYDEIVRRVREMQRQQPRERINRLVWEVISQPAPQFYLTEKSAYVILNRIRKESVC